jgi:hypothetical protein
MVDRRYTDAAIAAGWTMDCFDHARRQATREEIARYGEGDGLCHALSAKAACEHDGLTPVDGSSGLTLERPESIAPDVWRKLPPAPRASIAILRDRGHTVAVRINRNGSARYSVDGRREMDAATMSRIFKID